MVLIAPGVLQNVQTLSINIIVNIASEKYANSPNVLKTFDDLLCKSASVMA